MWDFILQLLERGDTISSFLVGLTFGGASIYIAHWKGLLNTKETTECKVMLSRVEERLLGIERELEFYKETADKFLRLSESALHNDLRSHGK